MRLGLLLALMAAVVGCRRASSHSHPLALTARAPLASGPQPPVSTLAEVWRLELDVELAHDPFVMDGKVVVNTVKEAFLLDARTGKRTVTLERDGVPLAQHPAGVAVTGLAIVEGPRDFSAYDIRTGGLVWRNTYDWATNLTHCWHRSPEGAGYGLFWISQCEVWGPLRRLYEADEEYFGRKHDLRLQRLVALDPPTGRVQWQRDYQSKPPGFYSADLLADDTGLYVATEDILEALELDNGHVRWRKPILPKRSEWGRDLLVRGDSLRIDDALTPGRRRLDLVSGAEKPTDWQDKIFKFSPTANLLYRDESIVALDGAGRELWSRLPEKGAYLGCAAVDADALYFPSMLVDGDSGVRKEVLEAWDIRTGHTAARLETGSAGYSRIVPASLPTGEAIVITSDPALQSPQPGKPILVKGWMRVGKR